MAKEQIVVGLEIGTSKVAAVVGDVRPDQPIHILGVGLTPSRGVRKGELVDLETAARCVRDALADAETASDVDIRSVYLGVAGAHIRSFQSRGSVLIPEDQGEVYFAHIQQVQESARNVQLPQDHCFLHSILQHYYVDGQDEVLNPVGLQGSRLEADFQIVHGSSKRIGNSINCVRGLGVEVTQPVFNAVAAAQVVLNADQKNAGAVMIDMGGGTTDFIAYDHGAVTICGSLAVGGDHITNDISLGLRLPMARAEWLKVQEGGVLLTGEPAAGRVVLKPEAGFAGCVVERKLLNTIIACRVREMLELVKRELDAAKALRYLGGGVLLTGGCSLLEGIDELAGEVFGVPVRLTHAHAMSGPASAYENPQLSAAIGLIKYAQAMQPEVSKKSIGRLFGRLWSR
ncbi:MAG: cell division protein FtsA [Verrucomicrobia bacterium]|nr:MAG: cell division protein FtsA [Verrucomicrobiota bacterium]